MALVGFIVGLFLVLVAVLAPVLAPHDPYEQDLNQALLPLSREYPFGTDDLGRCVFSRVIFGTRVSLQIGVFVTVITVLLGVVLGLVAGYWGGVADEVIMRLVDTLLAFPGLVLGLVFAGLLGPGLFNVMLALALVGWTSYARVVRGAVLAVKAREFVESAKALGAGDLYVLYRHVLPNISAPVTVMATLDIGRVILVAASLSFLGLGAQPPVADWGAMLNGGKAFIRSAPHLTVFPGLAIIITVMAFNFLGDGLRDLLDPRQRTRAPE
jgi:peptide/nickel transport system permease protein